MRYVRLWIGLGVVIAASFAVLGYFGREIYRQAPPIPERVVTTDGRVIFTGQEIRDGQNVWQSMGGQEVGSIWGHGAYVAPDWSADWLHREASWLLDHPTGTDRDEPYAQSDPERRAAHNARLKEELRRNTFDARTGDLVISPRRAEAIKVVAGHYASLFGDDPALDSLRDGGRVVGVVSHVAELRDRIPVQLVVAKSRQGSTVSQRVKRLRRSIGSTRCARTSPAG